MANRKQSLTYEMDLETKGFQTKFEGVVGKLKNGAKRIQDNFKAIATVTAAATAAFWAANKALNAIKDSYMAVAKAGDQMMIMQRRMQILTNDANAVDTMVESANNARLALDTASQMFQRFAIGGRQLGATTEEIGKMTTAFAQLATIGGATAAEIRYSSLQLGQAFGSGRLQGDELRSILENAPLFAVRLAEHLGVSVAELRKMGEQGQITAQIIREFLVGASKEIQEEFNNLPVTIEQSMILLKNEWELVLAGMDRDLKFSAMYKFFVETLLNAMRDLRSIMGWDATDLEKVKALTQEIMENTKRQKELEEDLNKRPANTTYGPSADATGFTDARLAELARLKTASASAREELEKLYAPMKEHRGQGGGGAGDAATKRSEGAIVDKWRDLADAARGATAILREELAKLDAVLADPKETERFSKTYTITVEEMQAARTELANRIIEEEEKVATAQQRIHETEMQAILDERNARMEAANARNDSMMRAEEWAQSQIATARALVDEHYALKEQIAMYEEYLELMPQHSELWLAAIERLNERMNETGENMTVFAEQAGRNIQDAFADFLFDPFEQGLSGMLMGFMNTMRRMAAEIAAKELLFKMFKAMSGMNGGEGLLAKIGSGLLSGLGGGSAGGGTIIGGRAELVGERGPELIIPSSPARVLNNHSLKQMDGGGSIKVEVINRGTPQQATQSSVRQTPQGMVASIILEDIKRNGPIASGLAGTYGLSRGLR